MKWRIVLAGEGHCYLVHADGESKAEALREAKRRVARELRGTEIRVRSAERIEA